jgi:hypothetical protein
MFGFLVSKPLNFVDVQKWFSRTLNVPLELVEVFEDWSQLDETNSVVRIQIAATTGDMALSLEVVDVENSKDGNEHVVGLVKKFCRDWKCKALMDDGQINPFTYILIDSTGFARPVSVSFGDDDTVLIDKFL